MKNRFFISAMFLVAIFFTITLNALNASAQTADKFYGSWQGRTYGATLYDPMLTFTINPKGTWTDLTFGEARKVNGKYTFDKVKKVMTLFSAKGSKLYSFKWVAATPEQKERLIEQLPNDETYRAMVCYRLERK